MISLDLLSMYEFNLIQTICHESTQLVISMKDVRGDATYLPEAVYTAISTSHIPIPDLILHVLDYLNLHLNSKFIKLKTIKNKLSKLLKSFAELALYLMTGIYSIRLYVYIIYIYIYITSFHHLIKRQ